MSDEAVHEQLAAYVLHALEPEEEAAFERHLAACARCRAELPSFRETAAALAFAAPPVAPPAPLRERVARPGEGAPAGAVVLPFRRRRLAVPALGAIAAAAAAAAIGLGIWASSLSGSLDDERRVAAERQQALDLLASGEVVPVAGARGSLVVDRQAGTAVLVLADVPRAPAGRTYQAWVIDGGTPVSAGVFAGGGTATVALEQAVRPGSVVAVTVEQAGGAPAPTGEPLLSAQA
ncbi:MAG: anti-sigma factor [Thermoleophilia bacterium]